MILTPHGTTFRPWAAGGSVEGYIEYLRPRAAGGLAMTVLEGIPLAGDRGMLDPLADRVARVADALRPEGAVTTVQLVSLGAQGTSLGNPGGLPLFSFNGMQSPGGGEISHRMTAEEIAQLIDLYAAAAQLAADAGLDGVELHGAHGYLIQQSFSPWGNDRDDAWGEPLAFSRAVLRAVRTALGPDKIVGFRMSVRDDRPSYEGGLSHEELCEIAKGIVATGNVDYFDTGTGSQIPDHAVRTGASYRYPHGMDLQLSASMRRAIDRAVPVVGVGRIITPEEGETALQRGECDLVGITRGHMADPDWMRKALRGDSTQIRRCVGANECGDRQLMGMTFTCFQSPEMGQETSRLGRAAQFKQVLVVGAGPAGLKAAEVAGRRGHRVTLVEQLGEPGGELRHVRYTAARELYDAVEWYVDELKRLDVELLMGAPLDAAALEAFAPDLVFLATGADARPELAFPGADPGRVISASTALEREIGPEAIVLDRVGTIEAALVAEALMKRDVGVTFVTPFPSFGPRIGFTHHYDLRAILSAGCTVITGSDVKGTADGSTYVIGGQAESLAITADAVVAVTPPVPNLTLVSTLEACDTPYRVIGDALAPRGATVAFRDGYEAARAI